jgi:hypothetical protein
MLHDVMMQVALEELYDRPVIIFNGDDFLTRGVLQPRGIHFLGELPTDAMRGVTPLRLSYHGGSHYNSVVPTARMRAELRGTAEREVAASGQPPDAVEPPLGLRATRVLR